ncbi:pirin family protein [Methylococcus capsulatus]|uniref:pirin family protein n=1 Tax=Methylococcus capsulatus TaxID=414 RepID=UPI001C52E8A1|nr:pirin family protein [Methylococcus capsulatus]QXP87147.1 pirin family protein [Methylococcus capsulatus]QXP93174.1 pirin family protein [Methylococcus capsulatus]
MIRIRQSQERGHSSHGWLDSRHTFSFGDYYDPRHTGFSSLRVINDDHVLPAAGFPTHPHRDMEIITYMLEGALAHKDSMGNGSVLRAGEVQRMTAGTGITHSEFNASDADGVHFLQIWILPDRRGYTPGYQQARLSAQDKAGRLCLVASPDGRSGSLTIHQDALLYATVLDADEAVQHTLAPGRCAYVHVARGEIRLNGTRLTDGDGAAMVDEALLHLSTDSVGEALLFDLAAQK